MDARQWQKKGQAVFQQRLFSGDPFFKNWIKETEIGLLWEGWFP